MTTGTWKLVRWVLSAAALAAAPTAATALSAFDEAGEWVDTSDPMQIVAPEAASSALAPASPAPSDGWAVFEDWHNSFIRSDRWLGRTADGHEVRREVEGDHLLMRFRLEVPPVAGASGFTGTGQRIGSRRAGVTTRLAGDFQIKSYAAVGCPTGTAGTRVRPVMIDFTAFNDGSSTGPGNATGDIFVRVNANREASSADPVNELTVGAFIYRCIDAACSNALSSIFVLDMGRVFVGVPFTLRATWDPQASRFLVGLDDAPDVSLAYPPSLNVQPPRVPFSVIRQQNVNANCPTQFTVTDSTLKVREIRTNPEAVVP